uniref:RNA helicase n=1 Tax=Culicoides sonorensis TaxID=179676 RepID=A0A336KTP2_CULSO
MSILHSVLQPRGGSVLFLRSSLKNYLFNTHYLRMAPHFREKPKRSYYSDKKQVNKFKPGEKTGFNQKALKGLDFSDKNSLTEIVKNLYDESNITKNREKKEIADFLLKHQINIKGNQLPKPVLTFEEINFPDYLKKEIQRQGFLHPTPIQSQAWPIALSGCNLVSIAQTGSGKTLGFLLPAIVHINNQKASNYNARIGPMILILAPTRELAQQIQQVASTFGSTSYIRNTCLFGGSSRYSQERELRRGVEIVIATPGRLIDFLESNVINLKQVTYLVLDEADRMLDMGFEPQIRKKIIF